LKGFIVVHFPKIELPQTKINRAIKNTAKKAYKYTNKKLDEKFTKRQKHLIVGTGALALAGLGAMAMIGRDPARAAKTLNGSLTQTKFYKQGEEILAEMLQKRGDKYSVNLEDFGVFFKRSEKFDFEEAADTLQKALDKMPKEAADAVNNLQAKIVNLINQRKEGFITMDGISTERAGEFIISTADDMEVLRSFFGKITPGSSNNALLDSFNVLENNFGFADETFDSMLEIFHRKINAFELCPKDLLPKDNIYYHGTGKARGILKKGITPFKSSQMNAGMMSFARECGAGVYLTPDIEVAQTFAGIKGPFGKILPYKAENMTTGITSQEGMMAFNSLINKFMLERADASFGNIFDGFDFGHFSPVKLIKASNEFVKLKNKNIAVNEILSRRIMLDNGLDSIYTAKGINSSKGIKVAEHLTDINSQLGRDERQFVVYSPEKLELQSRPLKTRVTDIKDRTFAFGRCMLNTFKGFGKMYKELFEEIRDDLKS